MTYEFDVQETLNSMAYASTVDLFNGAVTLYAVVCIGTEEQHFSHGGHLTLSAQDAITVAQEENVAAAGNCRYLPMAVGLDPSAIMHLAATLTGGGYEEPGDIGD